MGNGIYSYIYAFVRAAIGTGEEPFHKFQPSTRSPRFQFDTKLHGPRASPDAVEKGIASDPTGN